MQSRDNLLAAFHVVQSIESVLPAGRRLFFWDKEHESERREPLIQKREQIRALLVSLRFGVLNSGHSRRAGHWPTDGPHFSVKPS